MLGSQEVYTLKLACGDSICVSHDTICFWFSKVEPQESACWLWTGAKNRNGYGTVRVKGRRLLMHRIMYQRWVGDIPKGLVLDHKCRNRLCCNPNHLEAVTVKENTARGNAVLFK